MKSVLLGGIKVWLVNDGGKPLSAPGGRAKFYTAGTSTPETVYSDIDLTQADALGPVVYTDELGYLPAIWLKTDRLYKVRVEQKVPGSGNQWTLLWEVDNVGYIDRNTSDEIGDIPIFVNSISELKTVDHTENPVVEVLGYYEPGDWGEPSVFVFDTECVKAPDDGAYVLPSDQQQSVSGRWVQQFSGDVIDVRKFGALPDMDSNSDVSAKLVNAVHYSQENSTRTRPITVGFLAPGRYDFVGDFNFAQYSFVDLSDQSVHQVPWYIGENVCFNGNGEFILSKSTDCRSHKRLVYGTSSLSVEGGGYIKVDPAWWGDGDCAVSDCYVFCNSLTTNAKSFTRCHVESNGKLGGMLSLTSMGFKESWLVSGFDLTGLVLTDVSYDVSDCRSGNSYISVRNSQGDPEYGDMHGRAIEDAPMYSGNVKISNCIGSVVVSDSGYTNLDMDNCTLTLKTPSVPSSTLPRLYASDCAIAFDGGNDFSGVTARRCSLSTLGSILKVIGPCMLDYCDTQVGIAVNGDLTVKNSTVGANIEHTEGGTLKLVFTDNLVNAVYSMGGTSSNTVVNALITGNTGTVSSPVIIDRTNLDPVDSHHSYRYSGNLGTFLSDVTKPKAVTCTVHIFPQLIAELETQAGTLKLGRMEQGGGLFVFNRTVNFDTVEFFRIGADSFDVDMRIVKFAMETERGYNNNIVCGNATMEAVLVSGFTWGLRVHLVDPSDPTSNVSYNTVLTTPLPAGTANTEYAQALEIRYENMESHA